MGPLRAISGDGNRVARVFLSHFNLESPTRGNCDMIRKRKSTDPTHFFPSQGAAEVSMKYLAPVPLCPSHNERMKVNLTFTGYSCPSGGCSVTYTEGVGYFRFVNGFQQRPPNVRRCAGCNVHLYLAQRDKARSEDIWLCPNKECSARHV